MRARLKTPELAQDTTGAFHAAPGCAAITETQLKVLTWMKREPNFHLRPGGYGRAHMVSAARALVRKGILIEWRTATFAPRDRSEAFWQP